MARLDEVSKDGKSKKRKVSTIIEPPMHKSENGNGDSELVDAAEAQIQSEARGSRPPHVYPSKKLKSEDSTLRSADSGNGEPVKMKEKKGGRKEVNKTPVPVPMVSRAPGFTPFQDAERKDEGVVINGAVDSKPKKERGKEKGTGSKKGKKKQVEMVREPHESDVISALPARNDELVSSTKKEKTKKAKKSEEQQLKELQKSHVFGEDHGPAAEAEGNENNKSQKENENEKISKKKKHKRDEAYPKAVPPEAPKMHTEDLDTSKPSAVFKPKKGRKWTLSIAVPGSITNNLKAFDQKNALVGRIGRAAAVYSVDEIIVYDDTPSEIPENLTRYRKSTAKKNPNFTKADLLDQVGPNEEAWDNPDRFMFHLLSYMETPPHLRKLLFADHPSLRLQGYLPSLDMPHHMRPDEWSQYREGVAIQSEDETDFCLIEAGLPHPIRLPPEPFIAPNMRVTLRFAASEAPQSWPRLSKKQVQDLKAEPVLSNVPREEAGYYWGFNVRQAASLSAVYEECPFEEDEGYDLTIGTSERGVPLHSIFPFADTTTRTPSSSSHTPSKNMFGRLPDSFQHLLLVFGGVAGLEPVVVGDPKLSMLPQGRNNEAIDDFAHKITKETAGEAFDYWVNVCSGQGSRTIRTEEAIWIALTSLKEYVEEFGVQAQERQ